METQTLNYSGAAQHCYNKATIIFYGTSEHDFEKATVRVLF